MQLPLLDEVESIISIFITIFHTKIFNLNPLDFLNNLSYKLTELGYNFVII